MPFTMDNEEYLEFRGMITRVERIMSALLNLNDTRNWQERRVETLKRQLSDLQRMAGKLAEDLQEKLIEEAVSFKKQRA